MTKEFDVRILLGLDAVTPPRGQEIVTYDYEQEKERVRSAYADLLNAYGTTSGEVVEERKYPNPRFSMFRVTSRRKCPPISETAKTGGTSLGIDLESLDHTDVAAKSYDPSTLTQIFPDDILILNMKATNKSISPLEWQERTFHFLTDQVLCYNYSSADFPLKDLSAADLGSSRQHQATPDELEMLLLLHPFLEAKYRAMQPTLPTPKRELSQPKFGVLKWFSRTRESN